MNRMRAVEARQTIADELAKAGWDTASTFTVEEGARPGAASLDWWHENTPANESSETLRNLAYLRAYLKIAGEAPLYACGLLLDRRRLWMDRSIMSRLERDGYLTFEGEGKKDPRFALTERGRAFVAGTEGGGA